jgi:hypothetical protein
MGAELFLIAVPHLTPQQKLPASRVISQRRMSRPVGACPLYFGIGSAELARQNIIKIKAHKA